MLESTSQAVLFGLFSAQDVLDEGGEAFEGYSIDAWGQYQAAADSLRGYVCGDLFGTWYTVLVEHSSPKAFSTFADMRHSLW